ncbi:MAG: hypothetical protein K2N30_05575 [Clostridia bacterium]|nr:hypothetical protein [Clostridia bacterium]
MASNRLNNEAHEAPEVTADVKKQPFFKTNSFKCVIALLCVLLVSGIFLTIMNSLLYVTDAERFDRAINKIYGKSVRTESVAVVGFDDGNYTINEAYLVKDDGNYLINATGKGGFDNGTVTCWVVIEVKNGQVAGVGKVVIASNTAQSYISRVTDAALNQFGELYEAGIYYTPDLITAATVNLTKNAICNSVNGALAFVNARLGNVTEDIYTEYDYIANIETARSSHELIINEENEYDVAVKFTVVSKGYGMAGAAFTTEITVDGNGIITALNIVAAGSTDDSYTDKAQQNAEQFIGKNLAQLLDIGGFEIDGDLSYSDGMFPITGATNSTYSVYNAAIFAAANYNKPIDEYLSTLPPLEEAPDESEGGNE